MSLNIFQQVFANVDSNTKKMLIKENENPNQPVEIPKKKVHQKKKVSLPKEPPKKPTLEEEMGPIFKKIRSPNKGQTLPLQSTKKVEVVEPKKEENTKPTPNAEKNLNLVIFYNEEITVDNSIPQYNNSANEIKSEDEIVEEVEEVDPEILEATKTIIDNMFPDFNEPYIEKKVEEQKNKLQISHNQQELDFPSKNEMMAEILELAKTPPPPEIQLVDSSSYSSFSESKPVIEEAVEEIKPSHFTTPISAKRGIPIHVSPMTHQYINTNLLSESERNEREEAIQLLEEMKLKYSQMIDMKNEARSALNLEISKHKELEKQGYEMDNKLNQLSHENNQLDEILKTIEEDFVDKEAESEERWEFQANELQIELDALKQQLSK